MIIQDFQTLSQNYYMASIKIKSSLFNATIKLLLLQPDHEIVKLNDEIFRNIIQKYDLKNVSKNTDIKF